jgi:hypothetical protein
MENFYGGTPFVVTKQNTYWCESHQFFTWWKNNIERKTKFRVLIQGALHTGGDSRKRTRLHHSNYSS